MNVTYYNVLSVFAFLTSTNKPFHMLDWVICFRIFIIKSDLSNNRTDWSCGIYLTGMKKYLYLPISEFLGGRWYQRKFLFPPILISTFGVMGILHLNFQNLGALSLCTSMFRHLRTQAIHTVSSNTNGYVDFIIIVRDSSNYFFLKYLPLPHHILGEYLMPLISYHPYQLYFLIFIFLPCYLIQLLYANVHTPVCH